LRGKVVEDKLTMSGTQADNTLRSVNHVRTPRFVLPLPVLVLILLAFAVALCISIVTLVDVGRSLWASRQTANAAPVGGIGVGTQHNEYPRWNGKQRVNILILGVDQRPSERGPWRTDTMIVVSIDPVSKSAGVLSIPRDLWVGIPDHGEERINAAYVIGELSQFPGGGPALAKKTVQDNLGEPIHYYLRVNFAAFQQMIDLIGGVDVYVEREINDPIYPDMNYGYEPLRIPAGWQHMNGALALKYARTRHASSDFERAHRQQQVMLAVRDKVTRLDLAPALLPRAPEIGATLGNSIQTDLTLDQLVRLTQLGAEIDSAHIRTATIDETMTRSWTTPQGASVLVPERDKMSVLHSLIFVAPVSSGDEAAQLAAESARILVLNGSRTNGVATQAAERLKAQGLRVDGVGSADRITAQSLVLFYTGKVASARAAARVLGLAESAVVPGGDPGGEWDIKVMIGTDWKP
jgi:polyisoprenyl-teichoic acid--peptidoglycan teichoic acid transferase